MATHFATLRYWEQPPPDRIVIVGGIAMHPSFPQRLTIAWKVTTLSLTATGIETPYCQKCHIPLDVHQPDEKYPNHLLGTCVDCSEWYFIELPAKGDEAFMFNMPAIAFVREMLASSRKMNQEVRRLERNPDAVVEVG